LSTRQHTRDTVQGKNVGLLRRELFVKFSIDCGLDGTNQGLARELWNLVIFWWANLGDDIGIRKDLVSSRQDNGTCFDVRSVTKGSAFTS